VGIGLLLRETQLLVVWCELLVVVSDLRPATKIWNLCSMHGTVGGTDLNEMLVFVRVVQTGSFTTAATDLGEVSFRSGVGP
jgi:hypothetical protein